MGKRAISFFLAIYLCGAAIEVCADQSRAYLDSLKNKVIDISGLYDSYGFVGELVSFQDKNGAVLRLKGFVQKEKCPADMWKLIVGRSDATVLRTTSGKEAIAIDLIVNGNVESRAYDGYDPVTDEFVSQLSEFRVENVAIKAFALMRMNEDMRDILVQDASDHEKFNTLINELNL